jgi:hypothetical protein
MAQVSFNLRDDLVAEALDDFCANNPIPLDEETGLPVRTQAQQFKWCIIQYSKSQIIIGRMKKTKQTANLPDDLMT